MNGLHYSKAQRVRVAERLIIPVVRRVRWHAMPHGAIGARWRMIIVQMINLLKRKENATNAKKEENNTKG